MSERPFSVGLADLYQIFKPNLPRIMRSVTKAYKPLSPLQKPRSFDAVAYDQTLYKFSIAPPYHQSIDRESDG